MKKSKSSFSYVQAFKAGLIKILKTFNVKPKEIEMKKEMKKEVKKMIKTSEKKDMKKDKKMMDKSKCKGKK